ncbi:MAG: RNA 2'-phosphotransferase [Myxococcales bacterium]|nr:RNA 2'-phosphotransferase [Myxococcales bacterium]
MTKNEIRHSKRLSWLLRHGAPEAGIRMDPAGWVALDEVLRYLGMSRSTLDAVVRSNTKRRLQVVGARIRCCQGHSTRSGVTREALEASWETYEGDALIWHGTSTGAVASIAEEGVLPQKRTHVHLAPTLASVVGKRAQVDVMLGVDPRLVRAAGQTIWRAPNGVILARRIDPEHIVEVRAMTRRSRAQEGELRALFGARRSA